MSIEASEADSGRRKLDAARKRAKLLADWAASLAATSLSIGVSGRADEARPVSRQDYQIDLDYSVGRYPVEIRTRAGSTVRTTTSALNEEVSSFVVNADYHPSRQLEVFGFCERARDDLLGVQRRYEAGVGIKLEWDPDGLTPIGRQLAELLAAAGKPPVHGADGRKDAADVVKLLENSGEDDAKIVKDLKAIAQEPVVVDALPKTHGRVNLGLSLSVLGEAEQGSIRTALADSAGRALGERDVLLQSRQRFRVALRPSVVVRPSDEIELWSRIYWKHPLGSTRDESGAYDVRVHAEGGAKLKPSGSPLEVSIESVFVRDNTPIRFSDADLAALQPAGAVPLTRRAPRERVSTVLKITVKLK